jgi:RNA recognition motif-containing protein
MCTTLFVQRLPIGTTDAELQGLFEGVGRVLNCDVMTDSDTRVSKAFVFVEMPTEEEAKRAIDKLNGAELGGRTIFVSGVYQD